MPAETVQPNRGATVPDLVAMGKEQVSRAEWLEKQGIKIENRINLRKLSHMRYQHPILDEIQTFMTGMSVLLPLLLHFKIPLTGTDFGMQLAKKTDNEIWFKGYGSDQYVYYARQGPKQFLGGTFEAQSQEDFDRAARHPSAGPVQDMTNAPGGGSLVTITDPEGYPLNVIFGQAPTNVDVSHPDKLVLNFTGEKPRRREFNRFEPGPAAVHKLGHFGYRTVKFDALLQFYTTTFNIIPTDLLYVENEGQKIFVTMFAHLDLGDTLVDHHCIFFSASLKSSHVHHCSFEVHDFDTQQLGHQWLAKKGYKLVWGVGRHVLGSQIFDYWWDTTGNIVEHYADGDLVNEDTPIGYVKAGPDSLAVWGPEVPAEFLE